mmetsp:Transcript_21051/g.58816  ORF Transcript_21051/g.58816 Transcript_21051/m.58816 type:complete len:204 (-) Transcript_21051:747-1358(-)
MAERQGFYKAQWQRRRGVEWRRAHRRGLGTVRGDAPAGASRGVAERGGPVREARGVHGEFVGESTLPARACRALAQRLADRKRPRYRPPSAQEPVRGRCHASPRRAHSGIGPSWDAIDATAPQRQRPRRGGDTLPHRSGTPLRRVPQACDVAATAKPGRISPAEDDAGFVAPHRAAEEYAAGPYGLPEELRGRWVPCLRPRRP